MTQPIDRAFVEIEPDTRDFSRDLTRDVEQAYDKVERQTEVLSRKIIKSFDSAGREIERTFDTVARDGKITTRVVEKAFDDAGEKIQRTFKFVSAEGVEAEELIAHVARLSADTAADSFERAGERIEDAFKEARRVATRETARITAAAELAGDEIDRNFGNPIKRSFGGILDTIVSLGSAIVGLGAAAPTPAGLVAILAVITAIVALTGPIIVLVGALADLVGLLGPLPAALGVLVAAVLPLVFAFQGLGDAIKAVNEGDPEKITEAMKKLAPAARAVVREIAGLNIVFDRFRKGIQQSFFAPIVGDIGRTVRTLLPKLQGSFNQVAGALGRIAEKFLAFLGKSQTIAQLNALFAHTAVILDKIGDPLVTLFNIMLKLTNAGLPFIQRMTDAFGGLVDRFDAFIDRSIESGAFIDFVEDGIATVKELLDLVGALGRLFGAMFASADDEGRDFIRTLTDGVNALADFFNSADGRDVLDALIASIKTTVLVVSTLFRLFRFSVGQIKGWIAVVTGAGKAIGAFGSAVGSFFAAIGEKIAEAFTTTVDFFRTLPERIMNFLRTLPDMILGLINALFDDLTTRIGVGIGLVIFTFTELPKRVLAVVAALPELLGDLFTAAWTFAEQKTVAGIAAVISFVKSIPSRVMALAGQVGAAIANFFSRVFSGGKTQASNALDAIIGFFKRLPNRLGQFIGDVGARIGDAIKRTLNRAINRINEGIKTVDDKLPGSLPRIPNLAEGAIVRARPGGTLARIAEAGQDEIVGPLKDVAKLFRDVGGTTVTFGPGSVQVMFEGVVPTEQEAFQTGQAVGHGIIATLTRRNVRTSVRTL